MPSVGMRRSTRVFVPKSVPKETEEPRVLRSGKRLWSLSSTDAKPGRGSEEDDWFSSEDGSPCKRNDWRKKVVQVPVQNRSSSGVRRFSRRLAFPEPEPEPKIETKPEPKPEPRRKRKPEPKRVELEKHEKFGTGEGRKRPRLCINVTEPVSCSSSSSSSSSSSTPSSVSVKRVSTKDQMYGKVYARQQRRRRVDDLDQEASINGVSSSEAGNSEVDGQVLAGNQNPHLGNNRDGVVCVFSRDVIDISVDPRCGDGGHLLVNFLVSVLNALMRGSNSSWVRLSELAVFVSSEPIARAFSQRGFCISGLRGLRGRSYGRDRSLFPGNCIILRRRGDVPASFTLNFSVAPRTFISIHLGFSFRSQRPSYGLVVRYLMVSPRENYKSSGYLQDQEHCDNEIGISTNIPSPAKSTVTVVDEEKPRITSARLVGLRMSMVLNVKSRIIWRKRSSRSLRARRSSPLLLFSTRGHCNGNLMAPDQSLDLLRCDADILVVDDDRCYREERAEVMLEYIDSREWCLVVKRNGTIRYRHAAEYWIRSGSTNRVTGATAWSSSKGWKLEFISKQDWYTFKDLHNECVRRNIYATTAKEVPIPVVHEVKYHGDDRYVPFVRPKGYIQALDDEVDRAISRKTANYEIDSGDEEWLERQKNVLDNHFTHDKFEELIDVFEKVYYCNRDEVSVESIAKQYCKNLRTDIVAAVYQYWVEKRKLKNKALLRVFQGPPPERPPVLPQSTSLCKKKSFKKKGDKPVQRQGFTEQDARQRAEEAKNAATIATKLALVKRRRAQELGLIADLAVYKAAMALKMAQALQDGYSVEPFVAFNSE